MLGFLVGSVCPSAHAWNPVSLVPASAWMVWPVALVTLLILVLLVGLWQRDRLLDWLDDASDQDRLPYQRPAQIGSGRRSTASGPRFDARTSGLSQSSRQLSMRNSRPRARKPAPVMGFVQWMLSLDSRLRRRNFVLHDRDYLSAMLKADRDASAKQSKAASKQR